MESALAVDLHDFTETALSCRKNHWDSIKKIHCLRNKNCFQ